MSKGTRAGRCCTSPLLFVSAINAGRSLCLCYQRCRGQYPNGKKAEAAICPFQLLRQPVSNIFACPGPLVMSLNSVGKVDIIKKVRLWDQPWLLSIADRVQGHQCERIQADDMAPQLRP